MNYNDFSRVVNIYTSKDKLVDATLKNPLIINDDWDVREKINIGDDNLVIAIRKQECLQEL